MAADRAVWAGLAPPACCEFAPRCRVCTTQRLPLVTKGSCRRRRLKGSERCSLQSATLWCGKTCNFSSLPSRLRRATVSLRLGHGVGLTAHRAVIQYHAAASLPCSPRGGFGVCLSALVRTYLRGRTARAGQNPAPYAIGAVFAEMYRFTNNSQCKVLTFPTDGGTLRLALRDSEC